MFYPWLSQGLLLASGKRWARNHQLVRELQQDTGIAGHLIPNGAALIDVIFFDIHRNPEFWKDPEVFDPLRFHPDNIDHQHSYAYHVFHSLQVGLAGNCIGQNFAMNEESSDSRVSSENSDLVYWMSMKLK